MATSQVDTSPRALRKLLRVWAEEGLEHVDLPVTTRTSPRKTSVRLYGGKGPRGEIVRMDELDGKISVWARFSLKGLKDWLDKEHF